MPKSKEENDWLKTYGDTHLSLQIEGYTNWKPGEPSGDGNFYQLIAGSK